jgi:hypothetical protein
MFKSTLLLFLISSCSLLVKKIDEPLITEDKALKKKDVSHSYCPVDKKFEHLLVGTSESSQKTYLDFIAKNKSLDFLDHFAIWSLLQFSTRPDQSSPTSRLQVMFSEKGKNYYFDFFSEESKDQYPYLYGLQWILKKFNRSTTLEQYARIIDSSLADQLKIGKDLSNFLSKSKDEIKANDLLAPIFFRGAEVLREEETVPTLKYAAVIQEFRKVEKLQKIVINTSLTKFVTESGQSGSCNYDFNLYNNSIFLIDKVIPVANLFGLSFKSSAFMSSSSQKLDKMESLKGFPIFKGESKIRSSAVCVIENKNHKLWTFSNQSRDPGQHLFHLIRYGLPRSQSVQEVDRLIRHSRHLFLSDPTRLIIESSRSKKAQIENLLKLNLPIYNSDRLGNIWAFTQTPDYSRFVIDERNAGAFVCQ